jgi:glycosyltransferase involved in cell wall biosynthesis
MPGKQILYISYDGMTDPLGQSQVLPYIVGLSGQGYSFTLISCEKPDRFEKFSTTIQEICNKYTIDWHPLPFTTFPPVISKLRDQTNIKRLAYKLHKQKQFDMVHCRSYIAASIGCQMKKDFGTKFFFDMRGFWVDERVDGGIWDLKNPFFKFAYKRFKKKEQTYMGNADHIVSLTEAGKKEIEKWSGYAGAPFSIIPCSADFDLFQIASISQKEKARRLLELTDQYPVVSYLGSVGTWYLLDEMLQFFTLLLKKYPKAVFLFITPENPKTIIGRAKEFDIEEEQLRVKFATRDQVSMYLGVSDFSLSFIKPAYSKIASSPTKLGELFAMGIPVITNGQVGDVKRIVHDLDAGIVLDDFSNASLQIAVDEVEDLQKTDKAGLRERANSYYNLKFAIEKYVAAYKQVLA